jgi:hypothetical protein
LLLNIVYRHLYDRCRHGEKCTRERCAAGCGFRELDEWLERPVLKSEALADERREERLKALMRGDIPALEGGSREC